MPHLAIDWMTRSTWLEKVRACAVGFVLLVAGTGVSTPANAHTGTPNPVFQPTKQVCGKAGYYSSQSICVNAMNPNIEVLPSWDTSKWAFKIDFNLEARVFRSPETLMWQVRSLSLSGQPNGTDAWWSLYGARCNSNCYIPYHYEGGLGQGSGYPKVDYPGPYFEFRLVGITSGDVYAIAKSTAVFDTPEAPTDLAATPDSSGVDLTWADQSFNEGSFEVQRAIGEGGTFDTSATLLSDVSSYRSFAIPNTLYRFRVRAIGPYGHASGWSNEVSVYVSESMANGKDLVPYSAALAAAFAAHGTTFCEPLLLQPYPNTNGNSLNDVFESCEALILGGATLAVVLDDLATQAPDSVDELLDYWESHPAPTEEDEATPLPPPPLETGPDCIQEVKDIEGAATKIEQNHVWGSGQGKSEFYPWAKWRWLAQHAEQVPATVSVFNGSMCERVVNYEPAAVGVIRYSLEPTHLYTVVTFPDGRLFNMYPGTIAD